jgi:hypothetical protein
MEYMVTRVCDAGRKLPQRMRQNGGVRGTVRIQQEQDPVRHRWTLVARLFMRTQRTIPALYDATLVTMNGAQWVTTGHERIEAGPLRQEHRVMQTWILEKASVQDDIDLEARWAAAALEAHEVARAADEGWPAVRPGRARAADGLRQ